jgi:hypothetical protein
MKVLGFRERVVYIERVSVREREREQFFCEELAPWGQGGDGDDLARIADERL